METHNLQWSCNDIIYKQISYGTYSEELGNMLNSSWSIKIYLSRLFFSNDCFCKIRLARECVSEVATVKVKVTTHSSLYSEELIFKAGKSFVEVAKIPFDDFKNSKVDLLFKPFTSVWKSDIFRRNILSLLHLNTFTDITLKCGSESIDAHIAVLFARSSILKFMVEMGESKTKLVAMEDMDTSVFYTLIHFIYGGSVTINSVAFACDILKAAVKYQVDGLKEVCTEYLEYALSIENAVQLFEASNLYDNQLRMLVISYISDHLSSLSNSEEWKELKLRKPALALEVYSYKENQQT